MYEQSIWSNFKQDEYIALFFPLEEANGLTCYN